DSRNLAFLYLGSGISAGPALDRGRLRGSGRAPRRLPPPGHTGAPPPDPEGEARPCGGRGRGAGPPLPAPLVRPAGRPRAPPCGGRGCVSVSSLPAHIVDLAVSRGALPPGVDTEDAREVESALATLADRAEQDGDPVAAEILENAARGFARVAMQLANLLDLDSIVFGGPQWPPFEAACLRVAPSRVNEHYVAREDHAATARGAAIGGNVGAVGAASLAMSETMFAARAQLSLR